MTVEDSPRRDEEVLALQNELETTKTELEGIKAEKETLAADLQSRAGSQSPERGAGATSVEWQLSQSTASWSKPGSSA